MKTKDSLKLTPLLFAFQENNLDCINPLLEQPSIDIFSVGVKHNTPVHYACIEKNRSDILDFILTKVKGSTKNWQDIVDLINIENDDGETALMIACKNANFYAVKTLINTFRDSLDFSISSKTSAALKSAVKMTLFSFPSNFSASGILFLMKSNKMSVILSLLSI